MNKHHPFKLAALVKLAALCSLTAGLLAALPAAAGPEQDQVAGPIPLAPRFLSFGVGGEGVEYWGELTLSNTGSSALTVIQIRVTAANCGGCFYGPDVRTPFVVPAGESKTFKVYWEGVANGTVNLGTVRVMHSRGTSKASLAGYAVPF